MSSAASPSTATRSSATPSGRPTTACSSACPAPAPTASSSTSEPGAPVTATAPPLLPVSDADPFGHEILEDPLQFHAELREAGPVVYLSRYDVYAMGRHAQVHAAL